MFGLDENDFIVDISNYPDLPSDYLKPSIHYRYICQIIHGIDTDYTRYRRNICFNKDLICNNEKILNSINKDYDYLENNQIQKYFRTIVNIKDFKDKMDDGKIVFKIWEEFTKAVSSYLSGALYPFGISPFKIYAIYQCVKYSLGVIDKRASNYSDEDLIEDQIAIMSSARNRFCKEFIEKSGISPKNIAYVN